MKKAALFILVILAVTFIDSLNLTPEYLFSPYVKHILFMCLIYSAVTLSLNFVTGSIGQVSLGHAAFFGLGGYVSALLTQNAGWSFGVAFLAAGIVAALVGLPLGAPALRIRGPFLVVVTYGCSEVFKYIAINLDITGGPAGLPGLVSPSVLGLNFSDMGSTGKEAFIVCALLLAIFIAFFMSRMENSRIGHAFSAVREDEIAAGAMGINPAYYKLLAFVFSAFFAGLAGSLFVHYLSFVSPDALGSNESITMLTMVVVGGVRSIPGSFLGAFLLTLLPEALRYLKDIFGLSYDPWLVLFGFLLMVMMRIRPQGILGAETIFRRGLELGRGKQYVATNRKAH
ncbi:MAG: branched-chain amino acid transporter permease [Anaerosporomusa subterranea]|jgi:branched-chain amino acid transport system permease protein|nr:branched-chain amino acid transporter permease [Anaerosporomusa subterranea]